MLCTGVVKNNRRTKEEANAFSAAAPVPDRIAPSFTICPLFFSPLAFVTPLAHISTIVSSIRRKTLPFPLEHLIRIRYHNCWCRRAHLRSRHHPFSNSVHNDRRWFTVLLNFAQNEFYFLTHASGMEDTTYGQVHA